MVRPRDDDGAALLDRGLALGRAAVEAVDVDGVLAWRFEQLSAAGYEPRDAARIARRRSVDIRAAVALLERGCPPETALTILL